MMEDTITGASFIRPEDIEAESMRMISDELERRNIRLEEAVECVVKRVIHTTADFDFAASLCFSPGAVECALKLISEGAVFITDTNMARAGINQKALRRCGCRAVCYMGEEDVAEEASRRGITRAAVSMERAALLPEPRIFVCGNAPTALMSLYELRKQGRLKPRLVIGVPVGFVNVTEAKEQLMTMDTEYIVSRGRKGGSGVAAAICNSLLYYR